MRNGILPLACIVALTATSLPAMAQGGCALIPVSGTRLAPSYPVKAQRLGERDTVDVQVTVAPEGAPGGVAIARSSGSESLDEAALDNVRSRFWQPRGGCAPTRMIVRISYEMANKRGKPGEDFYMWRW